MILLAKRNSELLHPTIIKINDDKAINDPKSNIKSIDRLDFIKDKIDIIPDPKSTGIKFENAHK